MGGENKPEARSGGLHVLWWPGLRVFIFKRSLWLLFGKVVFGYILEVEPTGPSFFFFFWQGCGLNK